MLAIFCFLVAVLTNLGSLSPSVHHFAFFRVSLPQHALQIARKQRPSILNAQAHRTTRFASRSLGFSILQPVLSCPTHVYTLLLRSFHSFVRFLRAIHRSNRVNALHLPVFLAYCSHEHRSCYRRVTPESIVRRGLFSICVSTPSIRLQSVRLVVLWIATHTLYRSSLHARRAGSSPLRS